MSPHRVTDAVGHFWSLVDKTGDCWLWKGGIRPNGYGSSCFYEINRTKGTKLAHRVAYELTVGPLRDRYILHHVCENRLCVNPQHLVPMSRGEHARLHTVKDTCRRGHLWSENRLKGGYCRSCKKLRRQRYRTKTNETKRRYQARRRAAALAAAASLLAFVSPAHADVTLSIVPDAPIVSVLSPDGWTLTATGSGDISPLIVLPGHGSGELDGDVPGDPIYGKNDLKTTWQVTDAGGAVQSDRILTWPGIYHVTPDEPQTWHVAVLAPPLSAFFHAGAGAAYANVPVVGVAKGGQVTVEQSGVVNSGFIYADSYPRVMLEWDVDNTTNQAITLGGSDAGPQALHLRGRSELVGADGHRVSARTGRVRTLRPGARDHGDAGRQTDPAAAGVQIVGERLGLPAGFTLVSSTLGDPEYRSSSHSFSAEWSDAVTISPHSSIEWDVWLDAPCGQGVVHARLQVTTSDGQRMGTGNKGPALSLEAC